MQTIPAKMSSYPRYLLLDERLVQENSAKHSGKYDRDLADRRDVADLRRAQGYEHEQVGGDEEEVRRRRDAQPLHPRFARPPV
jgi:hypothetical protein